MLTPYVSSERMSLAPFWKTFAFLFGKNRCKTRFSAVLYPLTRVNAHMLLPNACHIKECSQVGKHQRETREASPAPQSNSVSFMSKNSKTDTD